MRYMSISRIEILYDSYIKQSREQMRIRDLREDWDITQKDIAAYLHIRQNTYSQYENGQRQLPIECLIALAKFYHTSTDYILGLTEERKPYR